MNIEVINLEEGRPTLEEALERLSDYIAFARKNGARVAKLIHGYGSSGTGGTIKKALKGELNRYIKQKLILGYVYGEDWNIFNETARKITDAYPQTKNDKDFCKSNHGITIVLVKL